MTLIELVDTGLPWTLERMTEGKKPGHINLMSHFVTVAEGFTEEEVALAREFCVGERQTLYRCKVGESRPCFAVSPEGAIELAIALQGNRG